MRTYVVVGLQGSPMVSLRAMWRGDDAPACAQVRLRVRHPDSGAELGSEDVDLASTPAGPFRVSSEVFFVSETWPSGVGRP